MYGFLHGQKERGTYADIISGYGQNTKTQGLSQVSHSSGNDCYYFVQNET